MHGKKILAYELQELERFQSIVRRNHREAPAAFCDYDNYDAPYHTAITMIATLPPAATAAQRRTWLTTALTRGRST